MALEPAPGLDPTTGAASAIAEVTLYNIYETLTKIGSDGSVKPLLAERWEVSPDLKTWTFHLRRDAKFHNGEPFDAAAVKYSFERATATSSTNKDKRRCSRTSALRRYARRAYGGPGPEDVEPDFLFLVGEATAAIVRARRARRPTRRSRSAPARTGSRTGTSGASITLVRWPGWRNAAAIRLERVTFRFISDPSAQVAALLSGDVDGFPRVTAARSLEQFRSDARFQVADRRHRAPRPSSPSTTAGSRSTTCACAARSPRRSTAKR